jgi:zinc-binding alcohol dehydrogenase/oxidoreductase
MKALVVNPRKKNSLELKEVPIPSINSDEVLIKMKAASLNHRDLYMNDEWLTHLQNDVVAGGDGAGAIVSLGEAVKGWNSGDEVMVNPNFFDGEGPEDEAGFLGGPTDGTFAEYVKVPAKFLLRKPDYLSMEEAASIPLALSTAWGNILKSENEVKEGETLLLQGIGGGVAIFILQLAVKKGINVIVTSSSEQKLHYAYKLGAVHGINYKTDYVAEEVMRFTNGRGADVVIDGSGKNSIQRSVDSLAENGRLYLFGYATGGFDRSILEPVNYRQTGMVLQEELEKALAYYEEQRMHPILHGTTYSLEDFKEAYQVLEERKQFGKIVFKI